MVTRVSKDRQTIMNIQSGTNPQKLSYDGEHIWAANSMDAMVSKLSLDGEAVATYPVGAAPTKTLSVNGEIWVTLTSDDSIVRLKH